tara:strand:+ start:115 stop:726 length:612 start_codon:yes stop_codon:yes gene_type:complete
MSSAALTGISYVVLKSGEHIIAWVNEVIKHDQDDDFRGEQQLAPGDPRRITVGYNLTRPCVIESECIEKPKKGKGPKQTGFKVKLTPWLPLTKTDPIAVPCDWVVTIAAPVDNLREMYKEDVGMTDNGLVNINPNQKLPSVSTQKQSPPLEEKSYDAPSNIESVQKEALREEAAKELGTDINVIEEMEKNGQDNQDSSTDESN